MAALEACPFCGTDSDLLLTLGQDNRGDAYYVNCRACDTDGPLGDDDASAARLWNTRALSAREEQVRRTALVEGARWAVSEAVERAKARWMDDGTAQLVTSDIQNIDPAAILEREKVKL